MTKRFVVKTHTDNECNECWIIFDNLLCVNLDVIYYNDDWANEDAAKEEKEYGGC